jgi:tetratricopeptide (TPR) repeat protein
MRINRERSRLSFRPRRSRGGCLPLLASLSLILLVAFFARSRIYSWLQNWLYPAPAYASLEDAQAAYARGDLERAIAYAEELYEHDPREMDALELLLRALIYRSYADLNQERDRARALSLSSAALAQHPYEMQLLGIHAFVQQANGNSEDAQRIALRVIRSESESISARLALSLAYGSSGLFEAALREGERAVSIATGSAPDWAADAYRVLAIAYSDLGRYGEASQAAETAISHHRRLAPLYFERALYAQQLGDMDTATAQYFGVIAFDEGNVKARFRLCELSSTLREHHAAIDWCSQVTEAAPGYAEAWYRLGREHYLNGDWAEAQAALNRCSSLQVAQSVPIEERRFECWYIQGQAAEVLGDCAALMTLYAEYQAMAASASLEQTWVYPPSGPPICADPTPSPEPHP